MGLLTVQILTRAPRAIPSRIPAQNPARDRAHARANGVVSVVGLGEGELAAKVKVEGHGIDRGDEWPHVMYRMFKRLGDK